MGARGKQSGASLSVISSEVSAISRIEPLEDLTGEQKEVWVSVVNRMPADWLREETIGVLAQYCRHVVCANRVANLIAAFEESDDFTIEESDDFPIARYNQLLIMQEREGRALSSLATRLRLTPQSSNSNTRKSKDPKPKRPWDN